MFLVLDKVIESKFFGEILSLNIKSFLIDVVAINCCLNCFLLLEQRGSACTLDHLLAHSDVLRLLITRDKPKNVCVGG